MTSKLLSEKILESEPYLLKGIETAGGLSAGPTGSVAGAFAGRGEQEDWRDELARLNPHQGISQHHASRYGRELPLKEELGFKKPKPEPKVGGGMDIIEPTHFPFYEVVYEDPPKVRQTQEFFDEKRAREFIASLGDKFVEMKIIEKSSITDTLAPVLIKASTVCDPINPAPPVTNILLFLSRI